MPRNRNESNPDVNSPIADDEYDSDEKMPGRGKQPEIQEPNGDRGPIRNPDIDGPYRGPEDTGKIYPIEEPPRKDRETGDVDAVPKKV